ncbi:hypothetical protein [Bradyrhizobium sediminis]|uniref:hypothetical protein n=1 Tax=Bradyrhizobium sediminis TaxID=2840469 RepID=UPI00350FD5DC
MIATLLRSSLSPLLPRQLRNPQVSIGYCALPQVEKQFDRGHALRGRGVAKPDAGYDFHRYRKLLAEAVDEPTRLALIDLLIEERARERLQAELTSERLAVTAKTVASILGISKN